MVDAIKTIEKINDIDVTRKINEIKELLQKEYDENLIYILDDKRNGKNISVCKKTIKEYKEILKEVNIIVD